MTTRDDDQGATAAALFERIWRSLASVLGTPATAILMRRALRGALAEQAPHPTLEQVVIVREDLEYKYVLPASWKLGTGESMEALMQLVEEHLVPLLVELTGPVGVQLLERIPELQGHVTLRRKEGPQ